MTLSPLAPVDIAEVMRLERLPGYDRFVGRFEADDHAARMAQPDVRYFGFRDGPQLTGFAILKGVDEPAVLLRRIAVADPGHGTGTRLLRAVMDWIFETTSAEALNLDVALGNARARHVYLREGFVDYAAGDIHHLMSISRARWAELRGR